MDNFFDKSLHFLGKKNSNVFALNIGAMDGIMFDEMIGYSNTYNFKVLYVEPIPYLFERLKTNIGEKGIFENCAISDYDGSIEMITIDQSIIDAGLVHSCFYGMSAVYPPKNGLGSEFDRPTVEKYGKMVTVPCMKLQSVLDKNNIETFDIIKIDAEGHDYNIFKQINFDNHKPQVVRLEWINLSESEQKNILDTFEKYGYKKEINGQDIVGISPQLFEELRMKETPKGKKVTLVTGLWNIGRDSLETGWSRTFTHYLEKFESLLHIEENLIIFGDEELETFVKSKRPTNNTFFVRRPLEWFKNNQYYPLIQKIRTNPDWYNQVGWLSSSTQAKLEMYNPLVMSKMFLLNDAKLLDPFDSDFLFWIDAGLSNTVHPGYFTHDKVLQKIPKYIDRFSFICFPYDANTEIHGFSYPKINDWCGNDVKLVCRGGFFGGPKNSIGDFNGIYYNLLLGTLESGLMGTEESIFSIMLYKYPLEIDYFEIESNGLLNKFFEDLKNDNLKVKTTLKNSKKNSVINFNNVGLYVITFNSPKQFETLIESMIKYDENFIKIPKKFLLNNSTDLTTTTAYELLCEKYGFEHIKKDNLGICGGRQFVAEHSESQGLDGYWWSEDDMFFQPIVGSVCKNGFPRYSDNFFKKTLDIVRKENFDFLKINFTEFYGDNSTQWSWYNVPQSVRESLFPNKTKLPQQGLDPDAPRTKFKNIKSHEGIPYADGEIYYCNWTHFITKEGNRKLFLETKWAHPYENTWMSHIYQETVKGNINPGILLMTPIEHNRFDHYSRELRREN